MGSHRKHNHSYSKRDIAVATHMTEQSMRKPRLALVIQYLFYGIFILFCLFIVSVLRGFDSAFEKTCFCHKKVQAGKDQEKAQSEKDSHSKNRGGKKSN